MHLRYFKPALIMLLALTPQSQAQSASAINGEWRWHATGGGQEIVLEFKVNDSKLTGTITLIQSSLKLSANGSYFLDSDTPFDDLRALFFPPVSFPIVDGHVEGSTVTFIQTSHLGTSGRGQVSKTEKLFYTGHVDGDRIHFRRTYKQTPDYPWIVGEHSVSFDAERVK
jgi:hypothetical protein